ncbi:unnamed protein product [Haemonchus placei]|uniref:Dynein light chain n=1 Tax=Haemonchus placei TaxID=6290 RepID=A0A0N4WCR7_HAEPC|nr:unnamed protein product [Haemonchus placei]
MKLFDGAITKEGYLVAVAIQDEMYTAVDVLDVDLKSVLRICYTILGTKLRDYFHPVLHHYRTDHNPSRAWPCNGDAAATVVIVLSVFL